MHLCALGDLVDDLLVSPESNSNRVGFGGVMLSKYGSVGIIMPGAEHFLDVGNLCITKKRPTEVGLSFLGGRMSSHKNDVRIPKGRNRANSLLGQNVIILRSLSLNQNYAPKGPSNPIPLMQ